jgi:sugar lactone lactonase YvrE
MMSVARATPWSVAPGLLSEGPRWHEERQELLWVDVLAGKLHRGRVANDGGLAEVETIAIDRHVGAVAPVLGGGYVLAAGQGFLFVDESGSITELAQPAAGRKELRMNDGACDPQGRFWAGTMAYDESPAAGSLYRLELDGSCTTMLGGLTISNGIGWSPDGATMYLNDSGTRRLDAFRFEGETGDITERHTLVRVDDPGVAPDGLTVDEEGGIWVALWGGGTVSRYAPDGSLLATL